MAIDKNKVQNYLDLIDEKTKFLLENQALYDADKYDDFKKVTSYLEEGLKKALSDSENLTIGIIGDMKAGKSTFLNVLLFDGKDILPKAATPMTAALTKITYAEEPSAKIHFYSREDWALIQEQSQLYDKRLMAEYKKYIDNLNTKKKIKASNENKSRTNTETKKPFNKNIKVGSKHPQTQPTEMSLAEFEKKVYLKQDHSEVILSSKELVTMAEQQPGLEYKLGETVEVFGELNNELVEYVGANGKFTPIVNYVELKINHPSLKNVSIIDTPGLNDPIVSRGKATKNFLSSCDVVILLSYCGQFADVNMIGLMEYSLPNAGVNEVIVIGSKLDAGILNESTKNFSTAYKKSIESYRLQYKNMVEKRIKSSNNTIFSSESNLEPLFISSIMANINKKMKNEEELNEEELNEEEAHILQSYKNQFKDSFENKHISGLSGIGVVKRELGNVLERKSEIISVKNNELLARSKLSHQIILESIVEESVNSNKKLQSLSKEEIIDEMETIRTVIDSSRTKLRFSFEQATIDCKKSIENLLPELTLEQEHNQTLEVNIKKSDKIDIKSTGFLGLNKKEYSYVETTNEVNVSDVSKNIQNYTAKCRKRILHEFNHIFDRDGFNSKIKNILLNAFRETNKDFDEDEILIPVSNLLQSISIPTIEVDTSTYIDELQSKFKQGFVTNNSIHLLDAYQTKLLNTIEQDLIKQVKDTLINLTYKLDQNAANFADQIENTFCKELEKLEKQAIEKEMYIEKYQNFSNEIKKVKKEISFE